jgi:ankyrin repeat protein
MNKINNEATAELFELVDQHQYTVADLEKIKSLLSKDADPNYRQKDYPNETILYRVISSHDEKKQLEIVKLLLDYGVDFNLISDIFYPIDQAVSNDNIVLVQFMLENGASHGLDEALKSAIERNYIDMVKLLLSRNVAYNEFKPYSKSYLTFCCEAYRLRDRSQQYEIQPGIVVAKLLLDQGADPNGINNDSSPLLEAVRHDFYELVNVLLDNGILVQPEICVSHYVNTPEMFQFLVDNEVIKDANEINLITEQTPLIYHTIQLNIGLVKYLIANGGNLYHKDIHNRTAFHYALWSEDSQFIDYLLDYYDVKKCHKISSVFDGTDHKKTIDKLKTILT